MRFMTTCGIGTVIGLLLLTGQALAGSDTEDEYRAVLRARVDASHGEVLFGTCSRCHGADGGGATDGSVPALAGQHFRVLARQLVDYRHDQRWDVRMEHFADFPYLIFAQDVADVAAYLSGLPRGRSPVTGTGEYLEAGATIYARRCAACHGALGEGDDRRGYPKLAAQHYPYLLRQLHDAVEGRRPNFPASHVRLLAHMDRDQFVGVSDYLSRLPP